MPDLDQLYGDETGPSAQAQGWRAKITRPPADTDETLSVEVLADGQEYDRCRWMPRGETLPAAGDPAVVVLDEDGDAWVACWWPA